MAFVQIRVLVASKYNCRKASSQKPFVKTTGYPIRKVKRISLGNVYTKKILTSGRRKHINDDRAIGDDLYHNGLGDQS